MAFEDRWHPSKKRKFQSNNGNQHSQQVWRVKSKPECDVSADPAISQISGGSSSYADHDSSHSDIHHHRTHLKPRSISHSHHHIPQYSQRRSYSSGSSSMMIHQTPSSWHRGRHKSHYPFKVSKRGISTRIDSEMARFLDSSKKTALVFDLDATLVDINKRMTMLDRSTTNSKHYWSVVLHGDNYYLDRPILVARAYVNAMSKEHNIIYVSGRRSQSIWQSYQWLEQHGYPKGYIIHRHIGVQSARFKKEEITAVKTALNKLEDPIQVLAYFGDRLWDDAVQSALCGVRPVLVIPDQWISKDHRKMGIKGIVEGMPHLFDKEHESVETSIKCIKEQPYWHLDYSDLIPEEFCTDVFGESKGE